MEGKRLVRSAEEVRGLVQMLLRQSWQGRSITEQTVRVRQELEAEAFRS